MQNHNTYINFIFMIIPHMQIDLSARPDREVE